MTANKRDSRVAVVNGCFLKGVGSTRKRLLLGAFVREAA